VDVLSQGALLLFVYLVGLRFDPTHLRSQPRVALVVSPVSMLAPFALGLALAPGFYGRLSGPKADFTTFAVFLGTAMSVTALPVLARILEQKRLLGTKLGTVAMSCAAVDDILAWVLLAGVTARVGRSADAHLWWMMGEIAIYGCGLALGVRVLRRMGTGAGAGLASSGIFLVLSAAATDAIGIHAMSGAFLAGALTPGARREEVLRKLERAGGILLPVFFARTGMQTNLVAFGVANGWRDCGAILFCAFAGKWAASTVAARLAGMQSREAMALGALLNTRGLVELAVLSAGYRMGVISPALYSMLVLMAIVTTLAASPALAWSLRGERVGSAWLYFAFLSSTTITSIGLSPAFTSA
jgi:Kef-type K+ transport system membrane component KefB